MAEDLFNFPEGTETPIRDARYPNILDLEPLENYENIRAACLSSGSLYEDLSFGYAPWYPGQFGELEWRRPHDIHVDPQFRPRDRKPTRFDCLQGDVGDCWLISSIQAMTLNEDLFEHIVPADQSFENSKYCGAFHFRLWQQGNWYDVVVDDRVPVFKDGRGLKGATSQDGKVFWGMLLEKAFAKHYATFVYKTIPSYFCLEVGNPCQGFQHMSGGITERIPLGRNMIERVPNHMGKSLKDLMLESYERRDMMCVGLMAVEAEDETGVEESGLAPTHAYTITKVVWFDPDAEHWSPDWSLERVKNMCFVKLMNPWGYGEWKGPWSDSSPLWGEIFGNPRDLDSREAFGAPIREDGEFWMELTHFAVFFSEFYVCNLEPTGFLLNRNIYIDYKTWHTVEVRGEWVEGISAWGPDIKMRHENPQFLFQFEDPVPDVDEYKRCKSVIDLSDRSATRDDGECTSFFVYFGIRDRLTEADLQEHSPENENLHFQFDNSNWQSFLVPGRFIIIPCTMEPRIDSKFLLRIFSPCPLIYIDDAGSISKPLQLEEQSALESNAIPIRMFIDSAQGKSEIDWVGLKEILNEAFNPNGSFFGMFLTFIKNVQAYFDANPLYSSDEYGNDNVTFTKDECRRMIAMLDEDHSGKLNISEFCNLWKQICFWIKVYDRYKDEEMGYLKTSQLKDALGAIGYDVNKRILHTVSYVYSNQQGAISYTDFILCGVTLQTTLSLVEKAGVIDKGRINFTLEEWVKKTLIL